MVKRFTRGFTLIELLVVIAIIGILAGIVLAALGNTRQQGADAGIKGNLDTIRTQAEVWAGANGNTYGTALATSTTVATCTGTANLFADPTIKQAITAAQAASGGAVTCAVGPSGSFWQIAVVLKTDTTQAWCVSSTGQAKAITATSPLNAGNGCL